MKPKARLLALGAAILLAAITGVAASVSVDFDHNVDFSHFKTFAFKFSDDQATLEKTAPLIHDDILATITKNLEAGGHKKVDADPDVYLTYYVAKEQNATISTGGIGYGPGPGWNSGWAHTGGSWGTANTMVSTYDEGTLIIDAFSAKTKNAIWRGAAHAVLPEKMDKAHDKVIHWIDKMFEKWAKQHENLLEAQGKKD
jgi:hypothetical protein